MNEVIESPSPRNALAITPPEGTNSQVFFQVIAAAASNPQVDVEKMERLWAMHERLASRDSEQAFNDAMMCAQGEMGRISADATNNQTRSKYATYGQLDRHVRPIYTGNGFSISFDTTDGAPEGSLRVLAYVSHKAGHTRTYRADVPSDGKGAKGGDVMTKTHATGSAMSYGMRYLLKMIFNLAVGEDDDDGNGAGGKVAELAAENVANKILDGLIVDLGKTTTDAQAAALWASGSKSLHATGSTASYAEFKGLVVKHRQALKAKAEGAQQ
jgi:hypothetical protein